MAKADKIPIFRPAVEQMTPYVPGEQPESLASIVKLNTNENPYPPSPLVQQALAQASANGALRRYPHPLARDLVRRAAAVYKIPADHILAGNGSDELLAMLFEATLDRNDCVAWPSPSYSLYETLAAIREARPAPVPWQERWGLPLTQLRKIGAKLTLVCNPNSPSGTFVPIAEIEELAQSLHPRLLVVDEAYVDFAPDNALRLLRNHTNLVVLRSFSKSFSLAGLRVGLAFTSPEIASTLRKVKDSYNLGTLAIAAGRAALQDIAWMRRNVKRIIRERAATTRRLEKLGFSVEPSAANFVFARLPGQDLAPLALALRRRGILVRHFSHAQLEDGIRISIGTPDEMAKLFAALEAILGRRADSSSAALASQRRQPGSWPAAHHGR